MKIAEEEKVLWRKRIKQFSVRDDLGLIWNGFKVPTLQQIENVRQPIHYQAGRHVRTIKILRKALADCEFMMFSFMGGLERSCSS